MARGQLSAGSLGGRLLRRTIPQKGHSVSSLTSEQDVMATHSKQVLPEGNRRVRTSAAMIGLAVSVGTYGLSLPHQSDQAVAAEPSSADPAPSSASASFETAAVLSVDEANLSAASESASRPIQHTVQEGQTLWDVARFYGIDAHALASANRLTLNSVLQVGQVLNVPLDTRIAQAPGVASSVIVPGYYGPVSSLPPASTTPAQADSQLKARQDDATAALKQKQENLRSTLAQLNGEAQRSRTAQNSPEVRSSSNVDVIIPATPTVRVPVSQALQPKPDNTPEQKVALHSEQFSGSNVGALGAVTYQVAPGDTLSTIARTHGVTVRQLLDANQISNPNYIFVGQALVIPEREGSRVSSTQFNGEIAAVPSSTLVDVPASIVSGKSSGVRASDNSISFQRGSTGVAARPAFTPVPQPVSKPNDNDSTTLLRYNHVENLKLEIDRLRDKHNGQATWTQTSASPVRPNSVPIAPARSAPVVAEPVNPEFNPDRYTARLQEIRDRIRPANQTRPLPATTSAPVSTSQVVAAAPLGSENYDPIKSRLGRSVSPELPSLGTGSEFLPNVPGQANGFIWPTKGVLTSPYGWRWGRMHKGIDIAGPIGTPIVAAAEGRVTYAGWNSGGYGYLVEIQHPDGTLTLYAHNNRILVQVGQEVAQGQQISEMGSTGYSTGPHLHFEIHPNGRGAVNPMPFLQARS